MAWEDAKYAEARNEKKGMPNKRWLNNNRGGGQYVRRHGRKSKCVAHEDNGLPITTWRKTKAAVYRHRPTLHYDGDNNSGSLKK